MRWHAGLCLQKFNSLIPISILGYLLVLTFLVAPLWVVDYPLLLDYFNHLARLHILAFHTQEQHLAYAYGVSWRPIINLGADILGMPLTRVFGAAIAGKLLVSIAMGLTLAGIVLVHNSLHQRWSLDLDAEPLSCARLKQNASSATHQALWPLLGGIFCWHACLYAGFLGFSLSLGFALIVFAIWLRLLERPLRATLVVSLLGVLVSIGHVLATACLFAMMAGVLLARWVQTPATQRWHFSTLLEVGVHGLALIPVLVLYILSTSAAGPAPQTLGWFGAAKLGHMLTPITDYIRPSTMLAFFTAGIGFYLLLKRGHLKVHPYGFGAAAVLVFLWAITPRLVQDTAYVDIRFAIAAALVLFAATTPRALSRPIKLSFIALLGAMLLRSLWLSHLWLSGQTMVDEIKLALAQVPPGRVVDSAFHWRSLRSWRAHELEHQFFANWRLGLHGFFLATHMGGIGVIERNSVFPTLFSDPNKQPVFIKNYISRGAGVNTLPFELEEITPYLAGSLQSVPAELRQADYFLILHTELTQPALLARIPKHLIVRRGEKIWLVKRPN
jgi:hypothetical protein